MKSACPFAAPGLGSPRVARRWSACRGEDLPVRTEYIMWRGLPIILGSAAAIGYFIHRRRRRRANVLAFQSCHVQTLNGYKLYISLPLSYKRNDTTRHPVVVVLDAEPYLCAHLAQDFRIPPHPVASCRIPSHPIASHHSVCVVSLCVLMCQFRC